MTQIAVKLPDDLVKAVDDLVASGRFPSRSSAVRRGLEALVSAQHREELDRRYEQGYRAAPESESEISEAIRLGVQAIHDEPWEKWW
jgi:Arc/MetJ-type ribon-helix-helix transcriptional regulator